MEKHIRNIATELVMLPHAMHILLEHLLADRHDIQGKNKLINIVGSNKTWTSEVISSGPEFPNNEVSGGMIEASQLALLEV